MLIDVGGRERNRADFTELCRRSGFTVTSAEVLPPDGALWLIEAIPA